jgi:Xaa-Pro aminopeptidase
MTDKPTTEETGTSSHDGGISERWAAFMRTGWGDSELHGLALTDGAPYHARRRTALGDAFGRDTLVIPTGRLKVRNDDCDYPFRPGSDFVWLTGYHESDAVLVLHPASEGGHTPVLYIHPRSSRTTDEFFRDRVYGELWVGRRPSLTETTSRLGVQTANISELEKALSELDPSATRVLRGFDPLVDGAVGAADDGLRDNELASTLSELRLVKDEWEIAQLRDAIASTTAGFCDVVRALPHDRPVSERLIDGVFGLRARHDGNNVGYGSIAASGAHATTLHWMHNDGKADPSDMLLLDAGVENRNFYTADITRTMPISGRFNETQRKVYDLVYDAQQAGIEALKPGVPFQSAHQAAMKAIAEGLEDWGILPVSAEESLQEDCGLHRRWTLHGTSHSLGLDVHDCSHARTEVYTKGDLAPGHVLTVEPGLYFQPDDQLVPPELRGIGVRIEDDVLITADGAENLSVALPRTSADVEKWMADQRSGGLRLPG